MNLAAWQSGDRGLDLLDPLGPNLNQDAGDFSTRRRHDGVYDEPAARQKCAAINSGPEYEASPRAQCGAGGPGGPATM